MQGDHNRSRQISVFSPAFFGFSPAFIWPQNINIYPPTSAHTKYKHLSPYKCTHRWPIISPSTLTITNAMKPISNILLGFPSIKDFLQKTAATSHYMEVSSLYKNYILTYFGKIPCVLPVWKNEHSNSLFSLCRGHGLQCWHVKRRHDSIRCKQIPSYDAAGAKASLKSRPRSINQFGFLDGRSTVLQLLAMLDKWTKIINEEGTIDCVYFYFKKAFDKVPHQRLIYKAEQYGNRGDIINWIKSFLSSRTQQVVINGESSECKDMTSGIP